MFAKHRIVSLLLIGCTAVSSACSRPSATSEPDLSSDFGTFNGASLELTAEGGFAPLSIHQLVRHDDHSFLTTQRFLCSPTCGAPTDSASGTLSAAATDSLFNIAWSQNPQALADDYGATPNSADMRTYALHVVFNGRAKSIRADDGTMPAQMRAIVGAMSGIIAAARR